MKKFLFFATIVVIAAAVGSYFAYFQPETMRVQFTSQPVQKDGTWRVSYVPIMSNDQPNIDESDEFRNEDTWVFLKFNSGKINAKINAAAKSDQIAMVEVYGWRFTPLSMFKNVLSVDFKSPTTD